MHLHDLKRKTPAELVVMAEELGIEHASTLRKQVAEDVKTARLDALQKLLLSQQYAFDDSQIGRVLPALFDPHRWLLWLGLAFVLAVYFAPLGIVGALTRTEGKARTVGPSR